jgi:type VI secretion system protein ImpL
MKKSALLLIGGYIVGLAAVALLILYALPLVAIGDWRPFDTEVVRWLTVTLVSLSALGYLGYTLYTQTKREKELAAGMAGAGEEKAADDSRHLQEAMNDALATLKKAAGSKGDYLYDLPWYIIIGPPGSGKTTALVNSGLNFPLSKGSVAGVGGTRYCDWWFTESAVLIDTAGRYTTQDSDTRADRQSWLSFLDLLRRNRPKQPINGALVCISLEDLLSLKPAEVQAHADAIRARLIELHDNLKVDFPVYAVFTKADLLAGFMEFFGNLSEENRRAVWGATFQTDSKTENKVGDTPAELDALIARLNQTMIDRLQDEPNPTSRVQIFGFPSQVASLKKPMFEFLTRIFEPTRYHANATLRGFYFTSGTQEGTPIDQLIGALARSFGAQQAGAARYSGQGKSFFLTNLLSKVIFGEAGWVSTNRAAARRSTLLKTGGYVAVATVALILAGAWFISYGRNSDLVRSVREYAAGHAKKYERQGNQTKIADRNFGDVLAALDELAYMPTGYVQGGTPASIAETFGLSQRPRLNEVSKAAYDRALYRLLRPRLMYRLEERLRANLADPAFLTNALPIYLMMFDTWPMDAQRVKQWWHNDWADNLFRGAENEAGRRALEKHLDNLIKLGPPTGVDSLEIDRRLVEEARKTIARIGVADRAFELLRANSRTDDYWSVLKKGGPDANLVFEGANGLPLDDIRVPYFFTYAGFRDDFLGRLDQFLPRMQREDELLLGPMAQQAALANQYQNLRPALTDRYQREFIAAWQSALAKLRIRLLTADKPRYEALKLAAGPTSPIAQLIESIRTETQLTRERPAQPATDGKAPPPVLVGGEAASAAVEAAFRSYRQLVEGPPGQRVIDELLRGLNDVYAALVMLNDPTQAAEGNAKFTTSLRSVQATSTRFPDPFRGMIQTSVGAFDSDAAGTNVARLQQTLTEQVTNVCNQTIRDKYPFKKTSEQDLSIEDFQRLFRPSGVIDRFYTTSVAQFIDTSKATWTWNQASAVGRQMPPALARDFQRAAEIREAFFPQGIAGFHFAMRNLSLSDTIDSARLEINTVAMLSERSPTYTGFAGQSPPPPTQPPPPAVTAFQWPGPIGLGAASLTLVPALQGRPDPPGKTGPWALFRLLDTATVTRNGDAVIVRFNISGREAIYQINMTTLPNPFTLTALREFRCPTAAP